MRPDQTYIKDIDLKAPILIIGGGSLGSAMAGALHRMGFRPDIVDFDSWEARNRGNNIWPGKPQSKKASAEEFDGPIEQLLAEGTLKEKEWDIVITATDNLESRAVCFNRPKPRQGFLDMRTGAYIAHISLGVNSFEMEATLPHPGEPVEELSCGERGSMAHTMTVAGVALSRLLNAMNKGFEQEEFQLGFMGNNMTLFQKKQREIPEPSSDIRDLETAQSQEN